MKRNRRYMLRSLTAIPVVAVLGFTTHPASANTGTCHNKTYRCKNRQKVQCGQGNTVNCIGRKGNYKGAATLVS